VGEVPVDRLVVGIDIEAEIAGLEVQLPAGRNDRWFGIGISAGRDGGDSSDSQPNERENLTNRTSDVHKYSDSPISLPTVPDPSDPAPDPDPRLDGRHEPP